MGDANRGVGSYIADKKGSWSFIKRRRGGGGGGGGGRFFGELIIKSILHNFPS